MHTHVESNEIRRAKCRRLRPTHGRAGTRVHFFHGQPQRAHQAQRVQHRKRADAVGDEIRRVFRHHDTFAEPAVAELAKRFEDFAQCFRPRDHFHQFQIPRRIEEVRPGPVLLKLLAHSLGDQMHGQSGRVGGHNRAGFAVRRDARQQFTFDFQIFRDDFDDPIGFRATRQVILKISDGNLFRERRGKKRGRPRLLRRLQPRANNLIALGGRRTGGQIGGHDVQQNTRQPGIREMRRDPRAHRSRPQHDCLFDATFHGIPFLGD